MVIWRTFKQAWLTTLWVTIFTLAAVFNGLAAAPNRRPSNFTTASLPIEAQSLTASFERANPASQNPKLDSILAELAIHSSASQQEALDLAAARGIRLSGDRVHTQILIQPDSLQDLLTVVALAGGEVTGISDDGTTLQGWLPVNILENISAHPGVLYIRQPAPLIILESPTAANTTTEGLDAINGPAWHTAGFSGAGVKIGIIDGGYQGYTGLLGSELPTALTVKNFVDGEIDFQVDGTTPHGTACVEIIHDIAPQADLYLAKIETNIDLQEAVNWLKDTHHVDIISTSVGWFNMTPGDGTGQFTDLVQGARQEGILWATAAGNSRDSHWGGAFVDLDGDDIHNYSPNQEINYFGPGGNLAYFIPAGYNIQIFLRWDDWGYVNQDYDLAVYRWNGGTWQEIASSTNIQNGSPGQTPTEYISAASFGADTPYGFAIKRSSSSRNVNLEVFAPRIAELDQYLPARSLLNLADAPAAITVAALDAKIPYPLEYYSSEGPTNGPGGAAWGGFLKPDISGFANVTTSSYPDVNRKFNGTSAATPHVAGAAALVLSADLSYSPDQIQAYLQDNAIDMGSPGVDTAFGYGRLYLGDPSAFPTSPPALADLPDQITPINGSSHQAIDLWAYTSDDTTPIEKLNYSIDKAPDPNAGISLQDNRYVNIAPAVDWSGQTGVAIRATDLQGLSSTSTFSATVARIWNGAQDTSWSSGDNWTPTGVPAPDEEVVIPLTANQPKITSNGGQAHSLTIQPGASLTFTDTMLTIEGNLTNLGTLIQTGVVTDGMTTQFLHTSNQAGSQTKYRGVDVLPNDVFTGTYQHNGPGITTLPSPTAALTSTISVSISGSQYCPELYLGVKRCYQIDASQPITASIRFYFTRDEANGQTLDELVVYHYDDSWIETPGPYVYGGSGDALFASAQELLLPASFALGMTNDNIGPVFLPLVVSASSPNPTTSEP